MNKQDYILIAALFVLACFIWLRDLTWVSSIENTLPILVAIPLFVWLGRPWHFLPKTGYPFSSALAISVLGFLLGFATGYTFFFTIGWALLLWSWLSTRLRKDELPAVKRLMVLPVMAFPWITMDCEILGWWFRLSSSWVTAHFFSIMGFEVVHEGTQILIESLPVDIGAPCSGLNVLQSMLIVGSVVAYIHLGTQPRYWWNLLLLLIFSWLANTLRILTLCLAALTLSADFAMGLFHTLGGWLVLFLMFFLCWSLFSIQRPKPIEATL